MKSKSIFEPFQLGSLLLQNRIVIAPMTRARGIHEGHLPTEIMETYYEQRSTAGLIISEGIVINEVANGCHNIPGIYNSEQVNAGKKSLVKYTPMVARFSLKSGMWGAFLILKHLMRNSPWHHLQSTLTHSPIHLWDLKIP